MTAAPRAQTPNLRRPVFGRVYAKLRPAMDRGGLEAYRRELLAGLSGEVIEIGCGDGGNFAHYPAEVAHVLAVEPEVYLRSRAEAAAEHADVPIEVIAGRADRLPAADGTFDAAVLSLVLCSVVDQAAALGEARRVLRPGGQLRFLEHVAAAGGMLLRIQRALDATGWPRLIGGCHAARNTLAAIGDSGFEVRHVRQFRFPDQRVSMPTTPHVLGRAQVRSVAP